MTKKQFEENEEPLVMIVSFDPSTGKTVFDTYSWEDRDFWMSEFERDFPNMMHFSTLNKSAIEARKKSFNYKQSESLFDVEVNNKVKELKEKMPIGNIRAYATNMINHCKEQRYDSGAIFWTAVREKIYQ